MRAIDPFSRGIVRRRRRDGRARNPPPCSVRGRAGGGSDQIKALLILPDRRVAYTHGVRAHRPSSGAGRTYPYIIISAVGEGRGGWRCFAAGRGRRATAVA